jgi:hypothetical protein
VGENVGVGAAGVFEGVGEDGEVVEGTVHVYRFGEVVHSRCQEVAVESDRSERIAKNVTQRSRLSTAFLFRGSETDWDVKIGQQMQTLMFGPSFFG